MTPLSQRYPDLWRDFLRLARTQRRLAHEYRRWALEAEREGNIDRYRRYRKEANRLWESAKFHLGRAAMNQPN